jgi:uncharacterized protein (DUF1330 family)
MPAYVIARVEVTDVDKYREYMKVTPESIRKHHGKFIARGGEPVTLEGEQEIRRVVILEFPTKAMAQAWYFSEEYQNAKKIRKDAAHASFVIVDGAE